MSNELTVIENLDPLTVFKGGLDDILDKIEKEVLLIDTDISTLSGRKEIVSLARKVASSKTAIENVGKKLGEEHRAALKEINADRKKSWERLESLQHQIRQPLTDFENAEKERISDREHRIELITLLESFDVTDPDVENIRNHINEVTTLSSYDWQEFDARAEKVSHDAFAKLTIMLDARIKRDTEAAELERLRAESESRKQKEREEQIAREAAANARFEAEKKAEIERKAAADKAEKEIREAEERERFAESERLASIEKAKQAEINAIESANRAKEKAENDRIEAEVKAEFEKQAAIEAERKRIADEKAKEDEETLRRESDKKHRAKINNEAMKVLGSIPNMNEPLAKIIIIEIAKGKIPNVKIIY